MELRFDIFDPKMKQIHKRKTNFTVIQGEHITVSVTAPARSHWFDTSEQDPLEAREHKIKTDCS